MIWDITLWIAAAVLVVVTVVRLMGAKSHKVNSKESSDSQTTGNSLTQGIALPTAAVVVLVLALAMKFGPDLLNPKPDWSDEQIVEVEGFHEAIDLYSQAISTKIQGDLINDDWETIRALLEASGSEMSMVSVEVLRKIHKELPSRVAKEFLPGIRIGTYGLMQFIAPSKKGVDPKKDPVKREANDSLAQSRELLGEWNAWFQANQKEILRCSEIE
ncbi:MAG: hypothetical protein J7J98_05010 [candidate division Zixibacteria bacterium]|nr:hypothetical protein [candidate division Zixibacteria bacterium]